MCIYIPYIYGATICTWLHPVRVGCNRSIRVGGLWAPRGVPCSQETTAS